jgi:hypothetical protein
MARTAIWFIENGFTERISRRAMMISGSWIQATRRRHVTVAIVTLQTRAVMHVAIDFFSFTGMTLGTVL